MIRVLIVDDHNLIRVSLRMLIEKEADMEVVGEAADGAEAAALAASEHPDVITLDLGLPDQQGLEVIEVLKTVSPEARILVVTGTDDANMLRRVMQAGAYGYVVKMADIRDLVGAIRSVHNGRAFVNVTFNDDLASLLSPGVATSAGGNIDKSALAEAGISLSDREIEVLKAAALGYSNKQIGEQLELSVKTIETYRSRLQKKLNLKDRAALVQFALANGLLSAPQAEPVVS